MRTWKELARGFTLPEVVVVMAISGIVVSVVATSVRDVARTSTSRQLVSEMQGEGREGIGRLQADLREASLGSRLGAIVAFTNAGVEQRPAVQLFDNVRGLAYWLDVKPGTDAVLVVAASARRFDEVAKRVVATQAAVTATNHDPVGTALAVTETTGFAPGQHVLVGPYKTAGWARVRSVEGQAPGLIQLDTGANMLPDGKADRGAMVRVAQAFLYYVDLQDQLVRREVFVPHAPRVQAELAHAGDVVARGIENMQVDCQRDGGGLGLFDGCPAVIAAGEISLESFPSGLAFPRLDATTISNLRTVEVSVVSRSREPLIDTTGDDPIAIGNSPPLPPSHAVNGVPSPPIPGAQYSRRAYRAIVGVRNTSLGVL